MTISFKAVEKTVQKFGYKDIDDFLEKTSDEGKHDLNERDLTHNHSDTSSVKSPNRHAKPHPSSSIGVDL